MKTINKFDEILKKVRTFPTSSGLYFMKGPKDKVLYIGKAKNIRVRVSSYFQKSSDLAAARGPKIVEMLNNVEDVDFIETPNEVEAMLKEARLIKDIRPAYNTELTDDKTFPYLEITTGDDFPGVYMTRKPRAKGNRLFGPFAGAKDLRAVLVELQKIFKFRTCTLDIREDDLKRVFFRPCILYSIHQCVAPCAAKVEKDEYRRIISDLVKFLKSKHSTILNQLKKEMAGAATKLDYEKAAQLRDRIRLIENLDRRGTPEEDVQPEVFAAEPTEALVKLQKLLNAPSPVRIIEGIDIATLQGEDSVGSLVCFIDGRPFKGGYKRFRIRTVSGMDDYAMIREVIARRYRHAAIAEELFPDVILIDGGLGQLHAALEAFDRLARAIDADGGPGLKPPMVISLAKREELIYIQARSEPVRLARNNPALRLLQQVRDESHRFGQHYHKLLRSKRAFEENHAAGRRPPKPARKKDKRLDTSESQLPPGDGDDT